MLPRIREEGAFGWLPVWWKVAEMETLNKYQREVLSKTGAFTFFNDLMKAVNSPTEISEKSQMDFVQRLLRSCGLMMPCPRLCELTKWRTISAPFTAGVIRRSLLFSNGGMDYLILECWPLSRTAWHNLGENESYWRNRYFWGPPFWPG